MCSCGGAIMSCVCGRPTAINDSKCGEMPPPAAKLSAAGVPVVRREKQARARDEAPEWRLAAAMALATCQVRSRVPGWVEAEQVTAGWPPWIVSVAAEAVRSRGQGRSESFEKLDKVSRFLRFLLHILLVALLSTSPHPKQYKRNILGVNCVVTVV